MITALKRQRRVTPRIDYTPLIDCAFTLIIFFAVSTSLITTRSGMKVNLPKAATVEKMPKHVQISIADDNNVYFEDLQVSADTLGMMVNGRVSENPEVAFIIGAAQSVPYERLMLVLDTVRANGGERIALQANQKKLDEKDKKPK